MRRIKCPDIHNYSIEKQKDLFVITSYRGVNGLRETPATVLPVLELLPQPLPLRSYKGKSLLLIARVSLNAIISMVSKWWEEH
jgi:hypothetical protein